MKKERQESKFHIPLNTETADGKELTHSIPCLAFSPSSNGETRFTTAQSTVVVTSRTFTPNSLTLPLSVRENTYSNSIHLGLLGVGNMTSRCDGW